MGNSNQIKGLISYLTRLTHTVDAFRFSFVNIDVGKTIRNMQPYVEIKYDLNIVPKQPDTPYLWDFFNCKSTHIIQDGCDMISLNWAEVFTEVKNIYFNGQKINRYGGNIPKSFSEKITKDIERLGPKQINTNFFCGGERKTLTLNVNYEVSYIYIDDGLTTDVSVYCSQALVDNEPLENINGGIAETIVGYMSEDDNLRVPLDEIVWNEMTKYMNLGDCEIWTHTYTYLRNIGGVDVSDFNYVNQSTFSSKLCDFISGD